MPLPQRFARKGKRRQRVSNNAKLFMQFPDKRDLGCLTNFDFAARKLPQPCHALTQRALLNQHLTA